MDQIVNLGIIYKFVFIIHTGAINIEKGASDFKTNICQRKYFHTIRRIGTIL